MRIPRLAAVAIALLSAVVCTPATATASDKSDVMAAINGIVGAFNKGDGKAWEAYCTSPASIISNIPPFQYNSATACADWWTSHAAADKKDGISNEKVTLGMPRSFLVTEDRAYAAFPADFAFTQKGKKMQTSGNVLTIALQKTASGWMVTGWSWAPH